MKVALELGEVLDIALLDGDRVVGTTTVRLSIINKAIVA